MITEDYCSFEVAKLLKEKGFEQDNPDVEMFYRENGDFSAVVGDEIYFKNSMYAAPTHQMTMKWFRDEKHIYIIIDFGTYPSLNKTYWIPRIETIDAIYGLDDENLTREFNTYEEAAEVAIKYCLENLI